MPWRQPYLWQYEIVQVTEVSTEGAETPLTEHNFVSLSGSTLTLAPSYSDAQEEARELRIYLRASRGMAQGEQVALVARIAAKANRPNRITRSRWNCRMAP